MRTTFDRDLTPNDKAFIQCSPNYVTRTFFNPTKHPDILEFLSEPDSGIPSSRSWSCISNNPNVTEEIVIRFINARWCWLNLSGNRCITIRLIRMYPNKPWNWVLLSRHENITWEDVLNNQQLPWDGNGLSENPNVTLEIFYAVTSGVTFDRSLRPKKRGNVFAPESWSWLIFCMNRSLTFEYILKHPEIKWDWTGVSQNPNVTWEDIQNNPHLPWDRFHVGSNPNITSDIAKNNPEYFRERPYLILDRPDLIQQYLYPLRKNLCEITCECLAPEKSKVSYHFFRLGMSEFLYDKKTRIVEMKRCVNKRKRLTCTSFMNWY